MARLTTDPLIGITVPARATSPEQQRNVERKTAVYRRTLAAHGARVVELSSESREICLDKLQALLLTGGGDVDPSYYGQRPHPKLDQVDPARDEFEVRLARAVLASGKPLLGICRGAQVLAIALGGRLLQDIPTQVEAPEQHSAANGEPIARHWVRLQEGSRLADILGGSRLRVNSSHHQVVTRPGSEAGAVAWSDDGLIEAVERNRRAFAIGVQWHPERMWRRAPRQGRLFAAFVLAARNGLAGRNGLSPKATKRERNRR